MAAVASPTVPGRPGLHNYRTYSRFHVIIDYDKVQTNADLQYA